MIHRFNSATRHLMKAIVFYSVAACLLVLCKGIHGEQSNSIRRIKAAQGGAAVPPSHLAAPGLATNAPTESPTQQDAAIAPSVGGAKVFDVTLLPFYIVFDGAAVDNWKTLGSALEGFFLQEMAKSVPDLVGVVLYPSLSHGRRLASVTVYFSGFSLVHVASNGTLPITQGKIHDAQQLVVQELPILQMFLSSLNHSWVITDAGLTGGKSLPTMAPMHHSGSHQSQQGANVITNQDPKTNPDRNTTIAGGSTPAEQSTKHGSAVMIASLVLVISGLLFGLAVSVLCRLSVKHRKLGGRPGSRSICSQENTSASNGTDDANEGDGIDSMEDTLTGLHRTLEGTVERPLTWSAGFCYSMTKCNVEKLKKKTSNKQCSAPATDSEKEETITFTKESRGGRFPALPPIPKPLDVITEEGDDDTIHSHTQSTTSGKTEDIEKLGAIHVRPQESLSSAAGDTTTIFW